MEVFISWLFDDIGKKLKKIAMVIAAIEIVLSVLGGVILFFVGLFNIEFFGWLILVAPLEILIGCLMAWASVAILYAFGELIDKVCAIDSKMTKILSKGVEDLAPKKSNTNASSSPKEHTTTPAVVYAVKEKPKVKPATNDDDTYVSGRIYHNGDRVKFEGAWYECREDGSGCVWNPKQNPVQWEKISG